MYREILFTTSGAGEFISGVILFDETIRQKTRDGRSFVEVLEQQGIVPGIKVDKGAKAMANFPGEKITEGLDGLRERLTEYRKLGARFAKWRAVITIGDGLPTRTCIDSNAEALARYAALCQEGDLVPIVEPEVLMDGTHTVERHFEVTEQTLRSVFDSLAEHRVMLEEMLLKPNMVLSGYEASDRAGVDEVAEATLELALAQVDRHPEVPHRGADIAVQDLLELLSVPPLEHDLAQLEQDAQLIGGGGIWQTGSYDPATKLYIVGTGNPYPIYDPQFRPGDNLYTNSAIALEVETGKLREVS